MVSSSISLIIPLMDAAQSRKVGCKAANLSKLIAARFAVPRGFVISADAHSFHLWASGVRSVAASMETPESRESTRAAIMAADIPRDIWRGVAEAYHRLSLQVGFEDPEVVVCSSPLEDNRPGAMRSLAGVSGLDALKNAIRQVWAAAWSEEAFAGGDEVDDPAVAVIVRQLIESPVNGVACTADPSTGDPRIVAISCENGEGRARFTVDLRDVKIAERDGELPEDMEEGSIVRLAEQAVMAERLVCSPIRIEWVYECGAFWILDAGPLIDGPDPDFDPETLHNLSGEISDWRVSLRPVSHMARSMFWAAPRWAGMRLENGYVVNCCVDAAEGEAQGWQPSAERMLEKWRRDIGRDTHSRSAAIVNADLAEVEYAELTGMLAEAADLAQRGADWLEKMRNPSVRYPELLREMLSGIPSGPELCGNLLGGLDCPSFMRDARLQELADRFGEAEKNGKLNEEKWWRAYRQEVERFAAEYGYAFAGADEMADPACWKSWIEDPDTVFRMIGAISRRGNRPSLVTLHCATEQLASEAEKEAAGLLKAADRGRFAKAVKAARGWLCAKDECEHAYALACTALRLVATELGRRLHGSGVIVLQEDVFTLAVDELGKVGEATADEERAELIATIAARKHSMWLEARLARQEEAQAALSEPVGEGAICGQAASPGQAAGRVRVAASIADAGEMEAGDILVVRSLGSAWTAFLGVAGGLVSEVKCGEVVGLPAVMRDYGVPVMTGCTGVMVAVAGGQRISFSGSARTVDLHGA